MKKLNLAVIMLGAALGASAQETTPPEALKQLEALAGPRAPVAPADGAEVRRAEALEAPLAQALLLREILLAHLKPTASRALRLRQSEAIVVVACPEAAYAALRKRLPFLTQARDGTALLPPEPDGLFRFEIMRQEFYALLIDAARCEPRNSVLTALAHWGFRTYVLDETGAGRSVLTSGQLEAIKNGGQIDAERKARLEHVLAKADLIKRLLAGVLAQSCIHPRTFPAGPDLAAAVELSRELCFVTVSGTTVTLALRDYLDFGKLADALYLALLEAARLDPSDKRLRAIATWARDTTSWPDGREALVRPILAWSRFEALGLED